jgi:DNA-binding transcriptional regulator YhcF (GntR family)
MTINFTIDPDLPLPLGTQLRGLIEYGIACGELEAGSRLPSVRALAKQAGIAPMTVSQVYKELQNSKLIEGRRGQGTFVCADVRAPISMANDVQGLQNKVDELIATALDMGYGRADVARLFSARLNRVIQIQRPLHLAMVGVFEEVTKDYAADLRKRLSPDDQVTGVTIKELQADPLMRESAAAADLILAFANRRSEVVELLQSEQPVMAISYIPSTNTRVALAGLDPMKRVGLVSTFADFLPTMKAGVRRFAPQAGKILATALGQADLPALLENVDVVIYATGAEEVVARLSERTEAFEYRHMLHPRELQEDILPLIARLRATAGPAVQQPQQTQEAT